MESGDKGNNRTKTSTEAVRRFRDYIRDGDEMQIWRFWRHFIKEIDRTLFYRSLLMLCYRL